ncbi:hypothetical protein DPMN_043326 [Dreissena polymorpha]|uniref:Uncharacterized protein n=1 Tax=Dreissena polymorpha TaxID=45954 RepID=A0A9D4D0A4_DREPO|nr:hypothetical protein DPMN_043326 [Dreissena polymorpha]
MYEFKRIEPCWTIRVQGIRKLCDRRCALPSRISQKNIWRSPGTVVHSPGQEQLDKGYSVQQKAWDAKHAHSAAGYNSTHPNCLYIALGKRCERNVLKQEVTLQLAPLLAPESLKRTVDLRTPHPNEKSIQNSMKGEHMNVQRTILAPDVCKPEVPVFISPASTVRFFTAPATDLAPTSTISVPIEPNLPYPTKQYQTRTLDPDQAVEFWGQYQERTCHT